MLLVYERSLNGIIYLLLEIILLCVQGQRSKYTGEHRRQGGTN